MSESIPRRPESNEISQDQAQEFVNAIELLEPLLTVPPESGGSDKGAEFTVGNVSVRVVVGEVKYEEVDLKAWNVFLDDANESEAYLQERFGVSKDSSGEGLGLSYFGAIQEWDDSEGRYKSVHPSEVQAFIEDLREKLGQPDAEMLAELDQELIKQVVNRLDRDIEAATGLDMNTFTTDRFERVMGFLQQCGPANLVEPQA